MIFPVLHSYYFEEPIQLVDMYLDFVPGGEPPRPPETQQLVILNTGTPHYHIGFMSLRDLGAILGEDWHV